MDFNGYFLPVRMFVEHGSSFLAPRAVILDAFCGPHVFTGVTHDHLQECKNDDYEVRLLGYTEFGLGPLKC